MKLKTSGSGILCMIVATAMDCSNMATINRYILRKIRDFESIFQYFESDFPPARPSKGKRHDERLPELGAASE